MSEKTLKVALGLAIVVVCWQLVMIRGQLADADAKISALRLQLDGLRRVETTEYTRGRTMQPEITPTTIAEMRTSLRRLEQRFSGMAASQPSSAEPGATADQTAWAEQRQAIEDVQSQLQDLLSSVEAIESEMQNLSAGIVELRASMGSVEAEITAIGRELVRLGGT